MSGIAMATCDNVGAFLEDLAKEILLNFYVKSLLRFKYVCNRGSQVHYRTLECSKKKPPQFLIYDYGAHDDAPHVTVISHNGIPSPSQGDNSQRFGSITDLLGSVDGLFFLEREIDRGILVRHLPAATIELQPFDLYGRHFGFGLDTMTKDYKVVYHYLRDKYAAVHYSWKIFKHDVNYN
ncbi:putative piriformospora indica-insensitive protein 2-like [Capsicum annuum]|nr:putative piriformospora indica-insensitive protein 2-like [Capsicum annuum]